MCLALESNELRFKMRPYYSELKGSPDILYVLILRNTAKTEKCCMHSFIRVTRRKLRPAEIGGLLLAYSVKMGTRAKFAVSAAVHEMSLLPNVC